MQHRFINFYWLFFKHFGRKVWDTRGAELVSAIVLTVTILAVSWMLGEKDANRAFEIGILSLGGWLAVFAVGHLVRTPVLLHREEIETEALATPKLFGILGMAITVLIVSSVSGIGWWWYAAHDRPMVVVTADPTAEGAEVVQWKTKYETLANSPAVRETRQITEAQKIALRKLITDYLVYSGPKYPNDAVQQPVTLQWMTDDNDGQAFCWQLNAIFPQSWRGTYSITNRSAWSKSAASSTKGVHIIFNARTYQVLALEDLFSHLKIHAVMDSKYINVHPVRGIVVAIGTP